MDSENELICGAWVARENVRVRTGMASFDISKGTTVDVKQYHNFNGQRQVLVDFGSRCVDWFTLRFLNLNFVKVEG